MDAPLVAVLDYGIGNLRSAQKSLERVGADARLTSDPGLVADAAAVVLPGVGHFGSCARAVREHGLVDVAQAAVDRGQPFLGICVGAQLMFDGSVEAPDEPGLGLLPGRIVRLPDGVKHPQMQWNRLDLVRPDDPLVSGLPDESWMYFVHSFAPETDEVVATCEYGGTVVAIAGRPGLWACQFHPEKSSRDGLTLLRDFVEVAAGVAA
ncbi:MAG: imidazole glycerol phosphate synthase subunit HisH [Actinomycetota bacterium]